MIVRYTILIGLLAFTAIQAAGQNKYDVNKIKPGLLINANAVVRADDIAFDVKSAGKAIERTHFAVTVFNRNADYLAGFSVTYDKFSTVSQLKAVLYNSKGEKIKEYNKGDFKDNSIISNSTMYDDNRIKSLQVYETNYPYTVEFTSVKEHDGILAYPRWSSLLWFNVAVESSSFSISLPEELTIRYKESLLTKVKEEHINGRKNYSWQTENIKAFENEPLSVGISSLVPWVSVAPNEFQYDNSAGDLSSWSSLGKWVNDLNKDGDILNPVTIDKVKSLTSGITDQKKKIEVLYNYLQNNTRYVSVQLGIGGFKPISAAKVAEVNYGDCKALSNYMKALLKQAGISSQLVVIKNEDGLNGSLSTSFSSIGQANHMILCVPAAKDTVWLECTSQQMPAGFIGGSNSNRNVLLISDQGGKIVRTPLYSANRNQQKRNAEVIIEPNGKSSAKISTEYEYQQFENVFGQLYREPKEQKEALYESLEISNPEVTSYSYRQPDKNMPKVIEDISLNINDLTAKGADKLFLTLNLMNKRSFVPAPLENRLTDFSLQMNYTDIDHISYQLPSDYKVEFLPKEVQINSEFGEYSMKAAVSGNKITYTRIQKMYSKQFPPARYQELVNFYKSIYKADKQKAVLTKI